MGYLKAFVKSVGKIILNMTLQLHRNVIQYRKMCSIIYTKEINDGR